MTAAPHRTRTGNRPEGKHLLLTLGLVAGSIAAGVFVVVYAWGEVSRIAAAFGFDF